MNNIKMFDDEDIFSWHDSHMNSVVLVRSNYFFWSCPLIIDQIVFKESVHDDPGTNCTTMDQSVTHNSNKMEINFCLNLILTNASQICFWNVPWHTNSEWKIDRNIILANSSTHCPKCECKLWTIDRLGLDCISIFLNDANYRYM